MVPAATAAQVVQIVVTLLAHGYPLQAIVAAYGFDECTMACWLAPAGSHSLAVHEHPVEPPPVEQPRDSGRVQAEELRIKRQGGVGCITAPKVAG
jgi:hypothetical protein